MNIEKISIIIPIYNVDKYLDKCLDTIINQTYKNLEIILINDGSTDNSLNICKTYAKKDERIIILNKENEGVSISRNKGIKIATGKYVVFMDADDYVASNHVEHLYNCMIENNVDLVISNAIDIKEDGTIVKNKKNSDLLMTRDECLCELLTEKNFYHVCWGNLYKKEFLEECLFNSNYRIAEDLDFLYTYISKTKKVYFTSKKTYYWVIRNTSATHLPYSEKWNDELNICCSIIDRNCSKKNDLYEHSIAKYIRANVNQAHRFNLTREQANLLRNNIKVYQNKILTYKGFTKKYRLKIILFLYSYRLFKIIGNMKEKLDTRKYSERLEKYE